MDKNLKSVLFNELRSVFDVELIESSKIEDLCST